MNKRVRKVVCAANRSTVDGFLVLGARHFDNCMRAQIKATGRKHTEFREQGFIDQYGVFMDRREAMKVALESGQPLDLKRNGGNGKDLYSEGIY